VWAATFYLFHTAEQWQVAIHTTTIITFLIVRK
jgi:low affinity Fe/Cu permease